MRRARSIRQNALAKKSRRPAAEPAKAPEPLVMGSRLAFALYALCMIGSLGTITALIEKAAP